MQHDLFIFAFKFKINPMKKIILLFIISFVFMSCLPKVALSSEYWQKPTKVGILLNAGQPTKFKEGSQGLLDMAVTSGDKYKEALDLIGQKIHPKEELVTLYSEILKAKGKEVVLIDEKFDPKTAKFKGEKAEGKKYATYDFASYKNKYGIDELLFVNVNYGFMISYYGMIETGKMAYTGITTQIVDLNDQHLILSNSNAKQLPLKKWKDNNYENSIQGVRTALDQIKEEEKTILK